jgi:hypothetical protein
MQPTVPTALGTVDRHHKSNNITLVADIRRSVLYQSACWRKLIRCGNRPCIDRCARQTYVHSVWPQLNCPPSASADGKRSLSVLDMYQCISIGCARLRSE